MTDDPVYAILRNILNLGDNFQLVDGMTLQEIPNMDSLAQVRLVMEIEKLLDDRLSIDEVIGMESVGNIRELLVAKGKLRAEC